MQIIRKARMSRPRSGFKFGMGWAERDAASFVREARGTFIFDMRDAKTGEVLHHFEKDNLITLDAGILAAILFKDNASRSRGLYMLAIGTGATGALLSPNAPDNKQRRLNTEIARKAFLSTVFRDGSGNAVAIPTNVVDFTTTFSEAEAVGPLNEMGLISPISDNPLTTNSNPDIFPARDTTRDLTLYDILVNYLTFSIVSKPSTAVLTITWRLTF